MNGKALSIIIPAYNTAQTALRCLDSVFSQLDGDCAGKVEVVAVEDCSPDGVGEMLDSYRERQPLLKVVHRSVNGGEAAAHNTGMDETAGEYFLRLDSDDALRPGALKRILEIVERERPDILLHSFTSLAPDGQFISQRTFRMEGTIDFATATRAEIERAFGEVAFGIMTPNVVYRRAAAEGVRQDPRYKIAGDRYFGWRVFRNARRFHMTNESFVDYYVYPTSLSHVHSHEAVSGLLELDRRFWNEFRRHPLFKTGRVAAFKRLFDGVVSWHYELVFKSGSGRRCLAEDYFAALRALLSGGASVRALGLGHCYLQLACALRSPRMVALYRIVFPGFIWRVERKVKRLVKSSFRT